MNQDISINGTLAPTVKFRKVPERVSGAFVRLSKNSIHLRECAVSRTPAARQHDSYGDQLKESAKRMLNASLRVDVYFDALGLDPVVAHANSAQ
ncbi:hypothetical protein MWU76_18665 [Gelidibacter sp. F2691]|nr:hypothetical protein [Gelidibacter sp. F2691]